jgi:hypothetical protein
MNEDPVDDMDRLFAHLERSPAPADLSARVLSRTVGRRATLAWPWLAAGLAALLLLALTGYQLGAALAASDGLLLLEAIIADVSLLATAPGDVLLALGEVLSWKLLAVAGVSAMVLIWAAGKIVSQPGPALRGRPLT